MLNLCLRLGPPLAGDTACENRLKTLVAPMPPDLRRVILRGQDTGRFLTVAPSTICGTILSSFEFRDSITLRFGCTPHDLQPKCDGCGQKFSVSHALSCKKGGLVLARHD